ncbi:M20/M25/M40 family metallo-hydrolase [Maribacter algicola]|uniref:M20/M25/M40 family metallo-hydrolase n=1 Tax=Maribacter algicola TaxID=2498892 RepID=A0A3R8PW89_9FLAO|nr:M20/M25/M40 family metallo-hydrolase [Maribacter algicola]RRQ47426.1 M20/M25/M40 family metallo-hydrolase [Maribacter algicola]
MKRTLTSFLLVLLLVSCGSKKINNETVLNPDGPDGLKGRVISDEIKSSIDDSGKEVGNDIVFSTSEDIAVLMDYLASDELQGRGSGTKGIEMAAGFIEERLVSIGVEPYFIVFKDTLENFEGIAYNVVGVLPGTDPNLKNEYVVLGAHYDHLGVVSPENGDDIANGANDNASGTATVMELARYFGREKSNKRSLIFAFFSAEEKGLLGSRHLAKKLKEGGLDLYTMLNYEMVGVPMVEKDHLVYLTGYELSNMAQVSNSYVGEKVVGFLPQAKEFNLFKRSDNYAFHQEFNVPSQTYSTFDFTNFPYYHKVDDEPSEMDYGHMAHVVNKMIPIVEGIANSPVKEIKYK